MEVVVTAPLPLPQLPRRLAQLYPGQRTPSYGRCYKAAVDGRLPASELVNGRWEIDPSRIDEVAAHFQLNDPEPHSAEAGQAA